MSNVETRKLYVGKYCKAETLPDGDPRVLTRPIYFRDFRNGSYLSIDEAEAIAIELTNAVAAAKTVDKEPRCVCRHLLSQHHGTKCMVENCACGPGCIHDGFVDDRG